MMEMDGPNLKLIVNYYVLTIVLPKRVLHPLTVVPNFTTKPLLKIKTRQRRMFVRLGARHYINASCF